MRAIGYFANGLGNFVMMMPALQAVASMTEGNKIDLCTTDNWKDGRRPAVEEICERWPVIEKVLSYPRDRIDPSLYDLWFYSNHGSGCEVVNVFQRNMRHIPVGRPSWRGSLLHEAEHYMEIAYAMGYDGPIPEVSFPLAERPDLSELKRPIIALCNGAFRTAQWKKKTWGSFPRLAEILKNWFGATVIGVGNSGELGGVPMDWDFTGELSITESAKVLSQCDVLVTTDTGNMHIANLLGVPLVALFGSTLVSKNGPRGSASTILQASLECAPCQDTGRFFHCNNAACMESISVGDVVACLQGKLGGK